jgi:hypothetical protein
VRKDDHCSKVLEELPLGLTVPPLLAPSWRVRASARTSSSAMASACLTARRVERFSTFARELERPPVVVAAAGVKLRSMIREGEQMSSEQLFEARPCSFKLPLALFQPALRNQHIGKAPPGLRIAARKRCHA